MPDIHDVTNASADPNPFHDSIHNFLIFTLYFRRMLPQEQIGQLKAFVAVLQAKPDLLHSPELSFFKVFTNGI